MKRCVSAERTAERGVDREARQARLYVRAARVVGADDQDALADQRGVARDIEAPGDLAVERRPVELWRAVVSRVAAAQRRGHLMARPVGARDHLGRDRDERRGSSIGHARRVRVVAAGQFDRRKNQKGAGAQSERRECVFLHRGAAAQQRGRGGGQAGAVHRPGEAAGRRAVRNAQQRTARHRGRGRRRNNGLGRRGFGRAGRAGGTHGISGRGRTQQHRGRAGAGRSERQRRREPDARCRRSGPARIAPVGPDAAADIGRDEARAAGAGTGRITELRKLARFRIVEVRQRPRARLGAPHRAPHRRTPGRVVARVFERGTQTLRRSGRGLRERMRREHGEKRAERQPQTFPQHAARAHPHGRARRGFMVNGCKTRMVNVALKAPRRVALRAVSVLTGPPAERR